MDSNDLTFHEWLGVLGSGLIVAAITAVAMPAPMEAGTGIRADKVQTQPQPSPQGAARQGESRS